MREAGAAVSLEHLRIMVLGVVGLHDLDFHVAHPQKGGMRPAGVGRLHPVRLAAQLFPKHLHGALHVVRDQPHVVNLFEHRDSSAA